MLDNIKMALAFLGILFLALGILVGMLGFLFKIGMLIIGLWGILTIVTWKKNELSENLIAIVVIIVGGGLATLHYWPRLQEMLNLN